MLRGRDRAPHFLQSQGEYPTFYRVRNPLLGWKEACLRGGTRTAFPRYPGTLDVTEWLVLLEEWSVPKLGS